MIEALENKNIYYSEEAFKRLSCFFEKKAPHGLYLLCDDHTEALCRPLLIAKFPMLESIPVWTVPAGEASKSLAQLSGIWNWLTEHHAQRDSLLINLGGGMITDLGGFAAASFKRGMDMVHLPTSLLAMVDASLGGKNGINWQSFKNQVGSFYQASLVGVFPEFLATLPLKERLNGYAEMMKHGLIAHVKHWEALLAGDPKGNLAEASLLQDSAAIKMQIVQKDPLEKGWRKALNFGHSIGHVLESLSAEQGQALDHGHAVALGLWGEAMLSHQYANLSANTLEQIEGQVRKYYALPKLSIAKAAFKAKLQGDKKNRGHGFNFTLLQAVGQARVDHILDWPAVEAGLEKWEILDWS